mmetsp:Transcript_2545/g.7613  ORF Transcript_2545/g.7613 Transcript_2545/m.7613 type:complete len:104 (-) Transcript_2545:542-853(-)
MLAQCTCIGEKQNKYVVWTIAFDLLLLRLSHLLPFVAVHLRLPSEVQRNAFIAWLLSLLLPKYRLSAKWDLLRSVQHLPQRKAVQVSAYLYIYIEIQSELELD